MSKLVACKACSKEIAKGVKKCPNCGKDQRSFFGRHKIITFIGAVVVVGMIGGAMGGGGSDDVSTTPTSPSTKTEQTSKKEEKVYKVGDVVKTGKVEASVTKFEEKDSVGSQYISKKASDGGTFVTIQYTMKNVSDKPLNAFSMPSVKLVDEKGTKYDFDVEASTNYSMETDVDNSKAISDLNPDISVTSAKAFEISKDKFNTGKWYIVIDGKHKVEIK
ncbi:hypothetical protein CN984_11950 [Bacillus cereus]|uniref:DUF4352 domain-containing protein n=1 Tax=Bacillus cereus TaxID=1396 RepID=A0A2B9Q2Y1_BACCE|nr:DUF4352 domain-containing protein [Bacillus cereus]PEA25866.1 hypothetical protein CON44_18145 [Bacillus cereus]PGO29154.1 hypothetical protein CN984_11950 [Bacillus cereus]